MAKRLNLTRDSLASFLKDHEQIKQFEKLFAAAGDISDGGVEAASIAADNANAAAVLAQWQAAQAQQEQAISNAQATAQQALALIDRLQQQTELLALAPPDREVKRSRYGSFLSTQTQVAATANTATAITINTTDLSRGVYVGTPNSRIYVDNEGVYNLQFSIQLDKTSGGTANFWIWPRVNGFDVANSASQIQIQGNNAEIFSAANFFFDLKAGDYIELMFAVSDVSVQLQYFAAAAPVPAIPSIIVTVSNNIQGVQQ
jgi:hypothetical protein